MNIQRFPNVKNIPNSGVRDPIPQYVRKWESLKIFIIYMLNCYLKITYSNCYLWSNITGTHLLTANSDVRVVPSRNPRKQEHINITLVENKIFIAWFIDESFFTSLSYSFNSEYYIPSIYNLNLFVLGSMRLTNVIFSVDFQLIKIYLSNVKFMSASNF